MKLYGWIVYKCLYLAADTPNTPMQKAAIVHSLQIGFYFAVNNPQTDLFSEQLSILKTAIFFQPG